MSTKTPVVSSARSQARPVHPRRDAAGRPAATDNSRRFPRSQVRVKARIIARNDKPGAKKGTSSSLEATLETRDISMTGVFFESTFFLKMGAPVQVQFTLPGDKRLIAVDGVIVREDRPDDRGGATGFGRAAVRSGFAVHFTSFVDDSAVVLASLFLAPRVKTFIDRYLRGRRDQEFESEADSLVDAVVGWELAKTEQDDLWAALDKR